MGSESHELDVKTFRSLMEAWASLRPENRPTKRLALWRLLREAHEYPHGGLHIPPPIEAFDQREAIVRCYTDFLKSSEKLRATLSGIAPGWFVLNRTLFPELSPSQVARLRIIEWYLPRLNRLPNISTSGRKPKKSMDLYAESIAILIFYYVINFEKSQELRGYSDGDVLLGREALLYEATLKGLGYTPAAATLTCFKSARNIFRRQDLYAEWSAILQLVGFASSQK